MGLSFVQREDWASLAKSDMEGVYHTRGGVGNHFPAMIFSISSISRGAAWLSRSQPSWVTR